MLIVLAGCSAETGCASAPPVSYIDPSSAVAPVPTSSAWIGVHRSVDPSSGAHFYTINAAEAAQTPFEAEALDYFYLWPSQTEGLTPFFRCLKPNGKRFYTTSETCENSGSASEGALGFIATGPAPGLTSLHRLYSRSQGDHLYTVRSSEKADALRRGYVDEGIAGYVWVPPLYIVPVSETTDPAVLQDLRNTFGTPAEGSNVKLGWSKSTWYMTEVRDASGDYAYDPSTLHEVFEIAVTQNLPLVINMNGGRWSGQSVLVDHLRASTESGNPTVTLDQNGASLFSYDFGQQYFSLSRLNRTYYRYKKRNLEAAAAEVAAFRQQHPDLFIGVSLDSETLLSDKRNRYGDYNPMAIEEWRQWLSGTGIYDPATGEYAGQARSPAFASIAEFNSAMGTNFPSWSAVQPPRNGSENGVLWHAWRIWGITMVAHHTQDMATWIANQGIPPEKIFNHQTPAMNPLLYGDDLGTAVLFGGATAGITAYKCAAGNSDVIRALRSRVRHLGIFEWNPQGDAGTQYKALRMAYDNTVRIVAPYHWPVDRYFPQYSIKGSPTETALRDFIRNYAVAEP